MLFPSKTLTAFALFAAASSTFAQAQPLPVLDPGTTRLYFYGGDKEVAGQI